MAEAYFPNNIPNAPLIGGFSSKPRPSIAEFEVDDGEPIVGPRNSSHVEEYTIRFPPWDTAQLKVFRHFWQNRLAQGSLPFWWKNPEDHKDYLFVFANPSEPFQVEHLWGGKVRVTTSFLRVSE